MIMSENNGIAKCLIIGSGPAGYTAAIYAARAETSANHDRRHAARRAVDGYKRCGEITRVIQMGLMAHK